MEERVENKKIQYHVLKHNKKNPRRTGCKEKIQDHVLRIEETTKKKKQQNKKREIEKYVLEKRQKENK